MMHGRVLVLILGAVLFSAIGQLLLKSGARSLAHLDGVNFLLAAIRSGHVLSGIAAWMVSTICWLQVLRVAPLSRAYGLTSLTYVLVVVASVGLLGEQVRRLHVIGTVLIVTGITCLLYAD
jgi:multidrug transporter EmrE-like cation transporter